MSEKLTTRELAKHLVEYTQALSGIRLYDFREKYKYNNLRDTLPQILERHAEAIAELNEPDAAAPELPEWMPNASLSIASQCRIWHRKYNEERERAEKLQAELAALKTKPDSEAIRKGREAVSSVEEGLPCGFLMSKMKIISAALDAAAAGERRIAEESKMLSERVSGGKTFQEHITEFLSVNKQGDGSGNLWGRFPLGCVGGWIDRANKAEAFKKWVHDYLDSKGIPTNPDGPHSKEGCRIGDRGTGDFQDKIAEAMCRAGAEEIQLPVPAATPKPDIDLDPRHRWMIEWGKMFRDKGPNRSFYSLAAEYLEANPFPVLVDPAVPDSEAIRKGREAVEQIRRGALSIHGELKSISSALDAGAAAERRVAFLQRERDAAIEQRDEAQRSRDNAIDEAKAEILAEQPEEFEPNFPPPKVTATYRCVKQPAEQPRQCCTSEHNAEADKSCPVCGETETAFRKNLRKWSEYPAGTIARQSWTGIKWTKTAQGWKSSGGSTFPYPGDADEVSEQAGTGEGSSQGNVEGIETSEKESPVPAAPEFELTEAQKHFRNMVQALRDNEEDCPKPLHLLALDDLIIQVNALAERLVKLEGVKP